MAWNILVIDDDVAVVERLMHSLQRADSEGMIGEIRVDDSITKDSADIEQYDPENAFQMHFDIVLIDYQLGCSFTGLLVSAWIAFKMKVPRISLTTASYNGAQEYFSGSILKRDITDNPASVVEQIKGFISSYDVNKWLNGQYESLVNEYHAILDRADASAPEQRALIENLLDKFERILDAEQETHIKEISLLERGSQDFSEKLRKNEEQIDRLTEQLDICLKELGKNG